MKSAKKTGLGKKLQVSGDFCLEQSCFFWIVLAARCFLIFFFLNHMQSCHEKFIIKLYLFFFPVGAKLKKMTIPNFIIWNKKSIPISWHMHFRRGSMKWRCKQSGVPKLRRECSFSKETIDSNTFGNFFKWKFSKNVNTNGNQNIIITSHAMKSNWPC